MKKRSSEEQIIGFLREADKGVAVKELCRNHGSSEASRYLWRRRYVGLDASNAKRLKGLTERRSLGIVGMSASALRYEPRPDRNAALRAHIVALARRHRR